MKNLVLILAAVLCSQAAFAQSDDYDQAGFPAPPVPAGEKALDSIKEIKISESSELYTYEANGKLGGKSQLTAYTVWPSSASCQLSGLADASNFKAISQHAPGSGIRFKVAPKKSITLKYKTSSVGVEEVLPSCNGEPELCENKSISYNYRTTITLSDKSGSEWQLSCVASFSRELYVSDVKIKGLQIN